MNLTGELKISARLADARLGALAVHLQRPAVARLFIGQPPGAVLKTVPYLYTLCAQAQRAAARAALAAAGSEVPPPVEARELWVEFLHETFWRLLLDWPTALGVAPAREAFAQWRNQRQGEACLEATQALIDGAFAEVTGRCLAALGSEAGLPASQRPPLEGGDGSLPTLTPDEWLPYWQGQSNLAPQWPLPASIGAAYQRRLSEARRAAQALAAGEAFPLAGAGDGRGLGIGQAWTARGILTHAVELMDGHVSRYRVWAPTDRYFADAAGLQGLLGERLFAAPLAARQGLEQAILALDPCLPYTLEFAHA